MPTTSNTGESFYDVLSAAVNDMIENGFDTEERIAFWRERLRAAAEAMAGSTAQMEDMLRDNLRAVYQRLVEDGSVLKRHPHVSKFTLERIKPELRSELDRRIMASASLIRLHRQEAIEQTLRRFSGWGTSIPAGGAEYAKRRAEKTRIRKAMAQLPFETRRVLIDQGQKLAQNISYVVAVQSQAIGGFWRSHYRQPGYNYRVDHKERDDKFYMLRDNWAQKAGFVKVGAAGYTDQITEPGEEVFCRCYYIWVNLLTGVPVDVLTRLGREAIAEGRAKREALMAGSVAA